MRKIKKVKDRKRVKNKKNREKQKDSEKEIKREGNRRGGEIIWIEFKEGLEIELYTRTRIRL